MPIKLGTLNISNFLCDGQIGKIIHNKIILWENWAYKEGILYDMTSPNTPAPFTCTGDPKGAPIYDGTYVNVFNKNPDSRWYGYMGNGAYAEIDLSKIYKIAEIRVRVAPAQAFTGSWTVTNEKGALLATVTCPQGQIEDAYISLANVECQKLRITCNQSNFQAIYMLQVTKWYQKGN